MVSEKPWVLALRALKLGDALVAVPALRALRTAFPDHRVVLAAPPELRPLVDRIGGIDLLPVRDLDGPLPPCAPDTAVNLHGAGPRSSELLAALSPARRIGHRGPGWPGPEWVEDMPERERWCRLLREHGIAADGTDLHLSDPEHPGPAPGTVVVHPGAAYPSKRWPAERFAAVARWLRDRGERVVLTGTEAERPLTARVAALAGLPPERDLAGRTGLDDLMRLVAHARHVLCGDTGTAHLSYAFGVPSTVLFGPVPASRWGPPANGPHRALSADGPRRGDPFRAVPDPALLGVTVPAVLHALAEQLID
ncbi:ADP-heptose:LPS heptosyltransferase [Actinoalloteichus cyanogriseus DSM 43889]|uniref:ADP-heptose:LPS heptosyltransferase n=2 Tax=Actinoalloteichus TaxID=65496 RepID=A0ABT1JC01_ACTCY|nr:ADP-heptose:LPS heptosyltransferase [Actinoalloteichus caeruleus DSM 43889]